MQQPPTDEQLMQLLQQLMQLLQQLMLLLQQQLVLDDCEAALSSRVGIVPSHVTASSEVAPS